MKKADRPQMKCDLRPWERFLVSGSVLDTPEARNGNWDPEVLKEVSGVDRIGSLAVRHTAYIEALDEFAREASPDVLRPNSWGIAFGHRLKEALEHRCTLWLSFVSADSLDTLEDFIGGGLIRIAGPMRADQKIPVALNPVALVTTWSENPEKAHYLRHVLRNADTLRASHRAIAALRRAQVRIRERSRLARLIIDPRFVAYFVVFVYSSLRALPVVLVPGFHGRVWVLWLIDIITAIPYTWGLLALVAGRTFFTRLAGLVVTIVTFVSPYIYFWMHGKNYPPGVTAFVVAMIIGAIALEGIRWLRDRLVARGLREGR